MKKSQFILLAIAAMVCLSCQRVLIGKTITNTATHNFEELWKGYDQWYGMFQTRKINWDSLYQVYRPQVNDAMDDTALYRVLGDLITPLNDIHAFLQPTSGGLPRFESSAFFRNHKVQQDFSIDVIRQYYLPLMLTTDEKLQYGILEGNTGYIHFADFGMPLKFYEQQMHTLMHALRNVKAMIVDIRNHEGGDDEVSRYIAGWFAGERKLFMVVRKRNGPGHNDFTAAENWYVDKQGDYQFDKPVLLLTTRWTASAGETFTWAMNTRANVTQMGDTTAGGFSDVIARELPNGWLYFAGVGDYRDAGGKSKEGIGIAPVITIVNTKEDIAAGRDRVLEAAIKKIQ